MDVYWNSPELLVVVDSEEDNGWQQLHDSYINGYPATKTMGFIQPTRIQVKLQQVMHWHFVLLAAFFMES
jgi:hypothetical protein